MADAVGSIDTPDAQDEAQESRKKARKGGKRAKKGPFKRLALFYRQVVAELRKVVWPTQQQLITYFSVVLVFVVVIMAIVSLLDVAFGKMVFALFG
jgi:preprotein translocase subunit SecE